MLRALISECEQAGFYLYLETETEKNVAMYKRFGFDVIRQITLSILDLPIWQMLREPTT